MTLEWAGWAPKIPSSTTNLEPPKKMEGFGKMVHLSRKISGFLFVFPVLRFMLLFLGCVYNL